MCGTVKPGQKLLVEEIIGQRKKSTYVSIIGILSGYFLNIRDLYCSEPWSENLSFSRSSGQ